MLTRPITLAPGVTLLPAARRGGLRVSVRIVGVAVVQGGDEVWEDRGMKLIAMAVMVSVASGCGGRDAGGGAPSVGSAAPSDPIVRPEIDVTAHQLVADYKGNVLGADKRYGDAKVRVVGKLNRVYRDPDGRIVAVIDGDSDLEQLRCVYVGAGDALAKIKAGDRVAMIGLGRGTFAADPILAMCDLSAPRVGDEPKPDVHCNQGDAERNRRCRERFYDTMRNDKFHVLETDHEFVTVELLMDHVDLCAQMVKEPELSKFEGQRFKHVGVRRVKCAGGDGHIDIDEIDRRSGSGSGSGSGQ